MRKKHGWLGPLIALGIFFVAVVLFILTAGNKNRGIDVHYTNGIKEIDVDGQHYMLLNDVTSESYIGSKVSDVLKCVRGEKVGTVSSYKILTLAIVYRVEGDVSQKYLVDSRERIYVKKEFYEETKAYLEREDAFSDYRIVGAQKNVDALIDIDDEKGAMITELVNDPSAEGLFRTDDVALTENYNNRREVFAFTTDGVLYKACLELFLHEGSVYVTTRFEDNSEKKELNVITGKLLPEELQEYFRGFWK